MTSQSGSASDERSGSFEDGSSDTEELESETIEEPKGRRETVRRKLRCSKAGKVSNRLHGLDKKQFKATIVKAVTENKRQRQDQSRRLVTAAVWDYFTKGLISKEDALDCLEEGK